MFVEADHGDAANDGAGDSVSDNGRGVGHDEDIGFRLAEKVDDKIQKICWPGHATASPPSIMEMKSRLKRRKG